MIGTHLKDAYIAKGMIVFDGPQRGGYASKGFAVELPSQSGASPTYLSDLETQLISLVRWISPDSRMQVTWSTDSDFRDPLMAFHQRTESFPRSEWSRRMRNERFVRYYERAETGSMRKELLRIFVSHPWDGAPTSNRTELERRFSEMSAAFGRVENVLNEAIAPLGGFAKSLGRADLVREFQRFLNPLHREEIPFDSQKTVLENFQLGDAVGLETPLAGFYFNQAYHAIAIIQSLPVETCSGIAQNLIGLSICDFSICVNITPLEVGSEIAKQEAEVAKLERALSKTNHQRMELAVAIKRERILTLAKGAFVPFRAQIVVRVWDKSLSGVHEKLATVKAGILRMKSAKPYEVAWPTSAVNYYRCTTPGWCWDKYGERNFNLYLEDPVLANLLPASGSANQNLGQGEALYDDNNGGLLAVRGFDGEPGSESPCSMLVCGKTGSGKSLFVNDFLAQSEPHYKLTVIVDVGYSYGGYVRARGGSSLVIEPKSKITFNYLDPRGPLTSQHLGDAVALMTAMCGRNATARRSAALSAALQRFYRDFADDCWARSPTQLQEIYREAVALEKFQIAHHQGETGIDGWPEYQRQRTSAPELFSGQSVSDAELLDFRAREDSDKMIHRLAYALIQPSDMPTHSMFCHWLEVEALTGGGEADELGAAAAELRRWSRDGPLGALLDGVGNVRFDSSLVHLEIGKISESAKDLREVALMLLCNYVKNELMLRPRSERKVVVLEEMSSLLTIPGAENLIRDISDRGRKNGVLLIAVTQQIGGEASNAAFASIVGNLRQAVFFKQTNTAEAKLLAEMFQLPETAKETLLRLPDPSRDHGSAFLHYTQDNGRPVVRVGVNFVHPEMLFVSGSSGEQHEEREALLRSGRGLMEFLGQVS